MNSYWNTTEAYDLSVYEMTAAPARQKPQAVPVDPRAQRRAAQKAAEKTMARRLVACAVLIVVFLGMVLYQNVSVIELGNEIQQQNELYASLVDEHSYLSGKLTASTTREVENYAAAQGLCKVQDYQTTYLRLNDADAAIRTAEAPTGSAIEDLMDGMDTVLEYLRIK